MENKESYTPQEVARIVETYVRMRTALDAVNNIESSPEVHLTMLGTESERSLYALREDVVKAFKERIPDNVFLSLSPQFQDITKLL